MFIYQKIQDDFQEKLLRFKRYVIQLRERKNYSFKHAGSADGTAMYFYMARNYAINNNCAK
jgi:hypothetical protein